MPAIESSESKTTAFLEGRSRSALSPLAPPSVHAQGLPHGRLPFGFGRRFLLALLLGLIWLIPAWWSPRLIAAMFLWDAAVIAAWWADLLRLPAPLHLEASRIWGLPLTLAQPSAVAIEMRSSGRVAVSAALIDEIPLALRDEPPSLNLTVSPAETVRQNYDVLPRERGDLEVGRLFVRYQTALGLAERWAVFPLSQTVRALPALPRATGQPLHLIRSRQFEMEKRRKRQAGLGREFEALREYRPGDDLRDVCWTATARRRQLITRTFQVERSQTVWLVVDAGRLLRARVKEEGRTFRLTKLDYAVNAALSLAQIATQSGDRAGLVAYGRAIQQTVGAGRGPLHIRALIEALAQIRGEAAEADHARAVRVLLRKQTRRALIVWITDFAETPTTPEVIEYATHMSGRHLVLFAALSQPDLSALARAIPQSEEEMFQHAAALEVIERRETLLRKLREQGVLTVDVTPGALEPRLINQYLEIKDRSLL
ncbi:MAG TPA: DUF58 domain-containing protein [Bryobacteraceae bacterium]